MIIGLVYGFLNLERPKQSSKKGRRALSLKAYLRIMRPTNAIFGSLTAIIGVVTTNWFLITTIGPRWSFDQFLLSIVLSVLTYICIAAAGNVVNDIYDLEVDKVNRPDRPLPSGAMSLREAKGLTSLLVSLGLVFAWLTIPLSAIGIWTIGIVILFAIVGLLYAAKGKVMGVLGNLAVAVSFAFGLFYGSLVTYTIIPTVLWIYFLAAACVLQGRETIKGIEDVEGDALRNVQTLARKYGIRNAAIIGAVFNIIGIIAFLIPLIANFIGWNWTGPLYVILVIPGISCVAASAVLILKNSIQNASRASLFDKIGAYLGLINIILGAIILPI